MKIASFTPIWNAEVFIKPHFEMLASLDKNIVLYNPTPWKEYADFHYESQADNSIEMIREMFPKVEIIETSKFGYNELVPQAKEILSDYDVITRFDVDMLMSRSDWERLIEFVRSHEYKSYYTKWSKHTINYYGDWEHGLSDAIEEDRLILPTKESGAEYEIDWDGWMIHHFRGWNKPKSIKKGFADQENMRRAHEQYGPWKSCPNEIREMFDEGLVNKWFETLK